MGGGSSYDTTQALSQILERHVNSMITRMSVPPADFAVQNNLLQAIAERGRLGIPLTISSDPRSHFQVVAGASVTTSGFSQWPETLGLGALDDPALVKRFASMVAQEYRAVGIQMALAYGRFARFPGNRFHDHVTPFLGAFSSGVVGVMPTYDILDGLTIDGQAVEPVGAGFNAQLLTTLLRGTHKFRGMVLSDWGITQDCGPKCMTGEPRGGPPQIAMPWGVESLTMLQRFAKGGARMLPNVGAKLFLHGVDTLVAKARGYHIVANAADADVALIRMSAPFQQLHPGFFFGSFQHEGDLDFKETDSTLMLVKATAAKVPTIVVVYLDRPAILTNLQPFAKTLIGEFGVSDVALFDVLTGRVKPVGRLPFELPRSMEAVQAQLVDVPHDSPSPLYPIGFRRQ